ncbi:MAG: hypothetical protein K6C34_05480 [Alphaproteobacteria bacterium]|nr:hypothetical protein [Alphaproteobacteria bacterium]
MKKIIYTTIMLGMALDANAMYGNTPSPDADSSKLDAASRFAMLHQQTSSMGGSYLGKNSSLMGQRHTSGTPGKSFLPPEGADPVDIQISEGSFDSKKALCEAEFNALETKGSLPPNFMGWSKIWGGKYFSLNDIEYSSERTKEFLILLCAHLQSSDNVESLACYNDILKLFRDVKFADLDEESCTSLRTALMTKMIKAFDCLQSEAVDFSNFRRKTAASRTPSPVFCTAGQTLSPTGRSTLSPTGRPRTCSLQGQRELAQPGSMSPTTPRRFGPFLPPNPVRDATTCSGAASSTMRRQTGTRTPRSPTQGEGAARRIPTPPVKPLPQPGSMPPTLAAPSTRATTGADEGFQRRLEMLGIQLQKKDAELQSAHQQNQRLIEQIEELKAKGNESAKALEGQTTELSALNKELASKDEEIRKLQTKLDGVKKQLQEQQRHEADEEKWRKLQGQIEQLEAQIQAKKTALNALEQRDIEAAAKELADKMTIQQQARKIAFNTYIREKLKKDLHREGVSLDGAQDVLTTAWDALKRDLDTAVAEKAALQARWAKAEEARKAAEERASDVQTELDKVQAQIIETEKVLEETKDALEAAKAEKTDLQARFAEAEEDRKAAEAEKTDLQAENARLKAQNQGLFSKLWAGTLDVVYGAYHWLVSFVVPAKQD